MDPGGSLCLAAATAAWRSSLRRSRSRPQPRPQANPPQASDRSPSRNPHHPRAGQQLFSLVDELHQVLLRRDRPAHQEHGQAPAHHPRRRRKLPQGEVRGGRGRQAPAARRDRPQEVRPAGPRLRPQALSAGAAQGADRSLLRLQDQDRQHARLGGRGGAEAGAGPRADPRPAGPALRPGKVERPDPRRGLAQLRATTRTTWPGTRWTPPARPSSRARPRPS